MLPNTPKTRDLINNFTQDLIVLVREALLEEVHLRLKERNAQPALSTGKPLKRLAAKPTVKALKPKARIKAVPTPMLMAV